MKIPEWLRPYLGRVALTLAGLAAGILFLTLGFWKTLVLLVLTALGFALGSWNDGQLRLPQLPARWRRK